MPPRFGSVVVVYYLIAVVMWGGGAIGADQLGVATEIVDVNESASDISANESTGDELQNLGGPIEEAVNSLGGGGLLATWNFVKGLLGALFWPVVISVDENAPIWVTGLAGVFSMAFLVAGLLLIRGAT